MFHTCAALMEGFINISICWSSTPTQMFTSWLCMAASLRSQQNSSVSLHQHACFCSIILGCAFERNAESPLTPSTLHFLPATGRQAFNSGHLAGNCGDGCIPDRCLSRPPRCGAARFQTNGLFSLSGCSSTQILHGKKVFSLK